MLAFWLIRKVASTNESRTEIKPVFVPTPPTASSASAYSPQPPPPPKRLTLTDVLLPLGSAAASYATSVGMKALGIPSPKDLLGSLIHKFSGSHESNGPPSRQPSDRLRQSDYESAMRRS